jgi:hypothetical protein
MFQHNDVSFALCVCGCELVLSYTLYMHLTLETLEVYDLFQQKAVSGTIQTW